jgi:hypothetical protein
MRKVREGLLGNFIPLARTVDAIWVRISISVEEIDGRRSLNCSKDENDIETKLERAAIGRLLGQARAAGRLLQLLNRAADRRPKWYDSSPGYAVLDDSLAREGLDILIRWMHQSLPPPPVPHGRWSSPAPAPDPVEGIFRVPRSDQLGFDIDELIRFLDADQIPHALGEALDFPQVDAIDEAVRRAAAPTAERLLLPPLVFRGDLAEVLYIALESARDPYNAGSVFDELYRLADKPDGERKAPLLGAENGEVKWWDEKQKRNRWFSRKDMSDRYRQLKKEAKSAQDAN